MQVLTPSHGNGLQNLDEYYTSSTFASTITAIEFNFIDYNHIQPILPKLRLRFPNVQAMRFSSNNLAHLHQLQSLAPMELYEIDIVAVDNPIASISAFRKYLLHVAGMKLRVISGSVVEDEEKRRAELMFENLPGMSERDTIKTDPGTRKCM